MKITMTRTTMGAANPSGARTKLYRAGETHDMEAPWQAELARVFLQEGWADAVEARAVGSAPENKALQRAPESVRCRAMR